MITFNGTALKVGNLHSTLEKIPGSIYANRKHFWGVNGVSEIVSEGVNEETIEADCWINDDASFTPNAAGLAALLDYLQGLDGIRGSHGDLIQSGTINKTYYNCTFEGFTHVAGEGQIRPDPVIACCGWIQIGKLTWTTLRAWTPASQ